MNSKKMLGNIVAVVIVLIGIILMGVVRNATGLGANSGISGALIIYSPLVLSFVIARFVSKRIQGVNLDGKDTREADLFKKDELTPNSKPDDQAVNE